MYLEVRATGRQPVEKVTVRKIETIHYCNMFVKHNMRKNYNQ